MKNAPIVVNPKSSFNTPPKTIVVNPKSSFNTPPKTEFHFFASSFYDWAQTTPSRTLPELIDLMNKFGNTYDLWLVPVSHDATYSIEWYAPQVEGSVKVGTFKVESKKKARKKLDVAK